MNVETILSDYQTEVCKLQLNAQLQLQSLYNEYTISVTRVNSDFQLQMQQLNASLLQLLREGPQVQTSTQPPRNETQEKVAQMTSEEYTASIKRLNPQQSSSPSTHQKENAPMMQELSQNTKSISERVINQSTQQDDEEAAARRAELRKWQLALEGETYEQAVEKAEKANKRLWIYQANSSVQLNAPTTEDNHNVIVKVLDSEFDFGTFTPSSKCIIGSVVGVGILGGL